MTESSRRSLQRNPSIIDRKRRTTIDVRIFLAAIAVGMAVSFGLGVVLDIDDFLSAYGTGFYRRVIKNPKGGGIEVHQKRRLPTAHLHELGAVPGEEVPQEEHDLYEHHVNYKSPSYENLGGAAVDVAEPAFSEPTNSSSGEQYNPSGHHLIVDMKNLEADFLNSEERLAAAIVGTIAAAGLTLLSYHCHALHPAGVSCVGVLLESHISFHTWPEEGVITLDLFTCGPALLLPVLPTIERLFGVPRTKTVTKDGITTEEKEEVVVQWSHELRGFRPAHERKNNYLDDSSDLYQDVMTRLHGLKKMVLSTKSPYQNIDIWEIIDTQWETPSYQEGVKLGFTDDDPRWTDWRYATPTRDLFIDGMYQTSNIEDDEFHEAMVHPSMFAHTNPTHVAIIGGGDGSTLREVLKHNTVESVTVIEIDKMMVDIAREYLPALSDCSNFIGRTSNCFDDEKVTVVYEEARKWFYEHFGSEDSSEKEKFDVVILDALDPAGNKNKQSAMLFMDEQFLANIYNSLSEDGIFAAKVGLAPSIVDPPGHMGLQARREKFMLMIEQHPSTGIVLVYEENHCSFGQPAAMLLACKDVSCRKEWYAESDDVDYRIYERIVDTKDGAPALLHYDGSTQKFYQHPSKPWETVYCRREPMPFECAYRGLDKNKVIHDLIVGDEEKSSFSLETVKDEYTGKNYTALFATVDIDKGSYIMADDVAASFIIGDESIDNLKNNVKVSGGPGKAPVIEDFIAFIEEHGHKSKTKGNGQNIVEMGGSHYIRKTSDASEANIGRWMPPHPSGKEPTYSPVYERHRLPFDVFLVATKDIKKGEEVIRPENLWS